MVETRSIVIRMVDRLPGGPIFVVVERCAFVSSTPYTVFGLGVDPSDVVAALREAVKNSEINLVSLLHAHEASEGKSVVDMKVLLSMVENLKDASFIVPPDTIKEGAAKPCSSKEIDLIVRTAEEAGIFGVSRDLVLTKIEGWLLLKLLGSIRTRD